MSKLNHSFAEIVESVAQATLDCYIDCVFNTDLVEKMQRDMRDRFKRMFSKIGQPISERAAEWLADEHLKLASINGEKTLGQLCTLQNTWSVTDLHNNDIDKLKKLFPAEISIIGEKLCSN